MKKFISALLYLLLSYGLYAQTCTGPGQNAATAFPVCGTSTFTQLTVPLCGGRSMPAPACTQDQLTDINPFWYKFTCFKSGTLGFVITPKNLSDDYDWQIYDVTGKDPAEVYVNGGLVISSNWSGEGGKTGASPAGQQKYVCGGLGKPLFSSMPALQKGHDYLMLVSHFTQSQSGYDLSFGGGTGVITDSTIPHLQKLVAACGGDILYLSLSKKIKCKSIAEDGSDFYITSSGTTITKSTGINCSAKFDTDSLQLQLSNELIPGTYTLHIKPGSDGNTLLDYCDNAVPVTDTVNFTITPKQPPTLDSLAALTCAPQQLKVILHKPILCSSIASNGSDFTINGTYPVTITGISYNCSGTTTTELVISLSKALQQKGTFTLSAQKGTDGNTVLDECSSEMAVGAALSFAVKDTVNAGFGYTIQYNCTKDIVSFSYPPENEVTSFVWNLDDNQSSNQQNPTAVYTTFTPKNIGLIVSNGFCSDTSLVPLVLQNYLKADFTVDEDNCPSSPIKFTDNASGKIVQYQWNFGDGGTSIIASPEHIYVPPMQQTTYTINYTVTDSFGCRNSVQKLIHIYSSCYIAVPNAFTPNGDGKNDLLYPLNAVRAQNLEFKVFNRWGQLIFKTANWKQGWDGTYKGVPQPGGVYLWMLKYIEGNTHQLMQSKGTAVLIR